MQSMFSGSFLLVLLQSAWISTARAAGREAWSELADVSPFPASQLPTTGAFYSAQHPEWPPLPANAYGLPAWVIGDGSYLLDDRHVDYGVRPSFSVADLMTAYGGPMTAQAYAGTDLWLAINAMGYGPTEYTADLTIHPPDGSTNAFWDLYIASTLDSPTDWRFCMRCPTNIIAQTNVFARYLYDEIGFFMIETVTNNCALIVSTNVTPQEMAELLMPAWVTVTNARYTGSIKARGLFSNGNCVGLPVDNGVILSSGKVIDSIGPNDSDSTSGELGGPPDSDLDQLVGGSGSDDAAALEFEITATNAGTLRFQYVYASEEYPEYSGSKFNDPFAVFITTNRVGTNWIYGIADNIALVPGTTNVSVTVNTLNGGCLGDASFEYVEPVNPWFYLDNYDGLRQSVHPYSMGVPVFDVEYDGMSVALEARLEIEPNVTYHLKIAIADFSDDGFDSAVFLRAWFLDSP
jgi:hypothetical protein